jgi:alpha-L-fucosidase 2
MKRLIFIVALLPQLIWSYGIPEDPAPVDNESSYKLDLDAPVLSWDEALPIGNGYTGALVWGRGNKVMISLDRSDIWDDRDAVDFYGEEYGWNKLYDLIQQKQETRIKELYDIPYDKIPFPTKLPGGRLILEFPFSVKVDSFSLDFRKGYAEVFLKGGKNIVVYMDRLKPVVYIDSQLPVKAISLLGPGDKRESKGSMSYGDFSNLNFPHYKNVNTENTQAFTQQTLEDTEYTILAGFKDSVSQKITAVFSYGKKGESYKDAISVFNDIENTAFETEIIKNKKYFSEVFKRSNIIVPDKEIQQHYNFNKYMYAAATGPDLPPMALQGVWTADTKGIPPWKGDYHFDLNVQMTYIAYYASGLFEAGEGLLNFMTSRMDKHKEFAKKFYEVDGLVVPSVMTYDGDPMGGWVMYSLSPAGTMWLCHNFFLHYKFTNDLNLLKNKIYPYMREVGKAFDGLLCVEKDGVRHLKLSSSPEIYNNELKAWLQPESNYDLSLIKWLYSALSELSEELGLEDETVKWDAIAESLDSFHLDSDGSLKFDSNHSFDESHRHHSNMMAIYPLNLLDYEKPEDKKIIDASLARVHKNGTAYWVGYSFSWASLLEIRRFNADNAYRYLKDFVSAFTSRNGFHLNGDQSGRGLTNSSYRPFTLEGNFIAAEALSQMLIHTHEDKIRVFSGVIDSWKDLEFSNLTLEGGHKASGQLKDGKLSSFRLEVADNCILKLRFFKSVEDVNWNKQYSVEGEYMIFELNKGEVLEAL